MSLVVSSDPATDPVTVAEAKSHMRVDTSDDDTLIGGLVTGATLYAQTYTGRAFVTQTLELRIDEFPTTEIRLPKSPSQSVTSIQYVDTDGDTQTWSSGDYVVDVNSKPARVRPAVDEDWPNARVQMDAVTVTFVAGYGAASDVPEGIKLAIKHLVAHWYENREGSTVDMQVHLVPLAIDALLTQYRIPDVG
tara:strand:- start:69 stop:644 length:576 start_codon:yes stop_codon:yes gene_type:complete